MHRVNVVIFQRSFGDTWHKGICVNNESSYSVIVDTKGNTYRNVYQVKDYFDEGSFNYDTTDSDREGIEEENQNIKL